MHPIFLAAAAAVSGHTVNDRRTVTPGDVPTDIAAVPASGPSDMAAAGGGGNGGRSRNSRNTVRPGAEGQAIAGALGAPSLPVEPPKQGNQLGTLATNSFGEVEIPGGRTVTISLARAVAKYFSKLISDKDLKTLKGAVDCLAKEKAIQDEHSSVLYERRKSQAVEAYALNPSAENSHKIRELSTLSQHDHQLVEFHSMERQKTIVAEQIVPHQIELHEKLGNLLQEEALSLYKVQSEGYSDFGIEPAIASPLVLALDKLAKNILSTVPPLKRNPRNAERTASEIVMEVIRFPRGGE
jgi:hypothetical protein